MVARRLSVLASVVTLLLTLAMGTTLRAQSSPVIVTPALSSDTVPTNGALDSMLFTVKNNGTRWTDRYVLTISCSTITCPTTSNPNPAGPFTLGPRASATTYVKFYHPSTSSSGTVSLTATDTSGLNDNTGTTTIVTGVPYVSLAAYSSSLNPASDGVIYQHATPVFASMGVQHAVTLVYNSATAHPTALVTVDASNASGGPYPTVYQLKVQYAGANLHLLNGSDSVYYTAGTTTTTRMVAAIGAKANGLTTGMYPVNVVVTAFYSSQGPSTTTVPSRIIFNDQSGSPLGAGVFVAGVPRLHSAGTYGMLLLDGAGSVDYFDRSCPTCAFISPAGESATLDSVSGGYRLVALDGSFYDFNGSGEATDHHTVPSVQDLGFTWNSPTQLSGISDAYGIRFAFSYAGPGGSLSGILDFANRTTSVSVANGRLTKVTDPDSLADSLAYAADSLLNYVKDRAGGVTSFAYKGLFQQDSVLGPTGTDYTGTNKRPTVAAATAALVVWRPGTAGTSSGAPKANVRPDTVMGSVTDPLGNVSRVAQDRFGLPTKVVDALNDTTTITRDTLGNALVVVAPNGHKTVTVYNGYLVTAQNDTAAGQYLSYTYDSSTSHHLETVRGGPVRLDYFYNTASDPGPLGALKMEYRNDTLGSGVWPPAGGDSLAHHFEDQFGRDTMVVDRLGHTGWWRYAIPASGGNLVQGVNAQGYAASYTYNSYGLPATSTVPTRGTDSLFYDNLGRTTRAVNPLTGSTQLGYGTLGMTHLTDPKGQVYKFDVNAWGLVAATHDLGDTTKADSAWYDIGGRTRIVKTRRGDTLRMTYDALGRIATDSGPDFPAASFSYCARGTCLVAANANGRDSITYDAVGRVASVVQQMPDGTTRDTILYTYDSQSRLVTRKSPNGTAPLAPARWVYDAKLGAVDTLCMAGACAGISRDAETKDTGIVYQPASGTPWAYYQHYNALHLPTQGNFGLPGLDTAFALTLSYDSLGRANTLQSHASGTSPYTKVLTYDALGRLTNDCSYNGTPYCWNEFSNLTTPYGYDSAGNDDHNGAVISGNRYASFVYDTLSYDANGAVTRIAGTPYSRWPSDTSWFTWNALGQLSVVRRDSAGVQIVLDSMKYDALGHRVAKTANGVTTWYVYDGDQVILDVSASTKAVLAEYGFDTRGLFAVRTATDTLIALRSPMNSTVMGLARATWGTVAKRYDVLGLPFGQAAADTGFVLRFKMGSQEYDQETGLYHLGARYYSPQIHRFLSEDPIGIAGGLNLYAYAGNDPINGLDPAGTCYKLNMTTGNYDWVSDGSEQCGSNPATDGSGGEDGEIIPSMPPDSPAWNADLNAWDWVDWTAALQNRRQSTNLRHCASQFAAKYSIAGGLHALGIGNDGGVGGFVTDALGGNAVAGAFDLLSSITGGSGSGQGTAYDLAQGAAAGPYLGLNPVAKKVWTKGVAGAVTDGLVETAYTAVAGEEVVHLFAPLANMAAKVASGIGLAKLVYDGLSYAVGTAVCAATR